MLAKTKQILNGDIHMASHVYECDNCGAEILESFSRLSEDVKDYCGDCAFKLGLVTEKQYLQNFVFFISLPGLRAGINPNTNEIEVTTFKFSWEHKKQERNSPQYIKWRTSVFKRDDFTCCICNKRGGALEAHHIKPFKKYKKERLNIDNGVTLCKQCHKQVHKEGHNEWLHSD